MNKKEFSSYILEKIKGMSLERQIEQLIKIKDNYLPSLIQKKQKELGIWIEPEKRNEYMYCDKCRKYSVIKKCKITMEEEVRTVATYIDGAYGDGDMDGDVLFVVEYAICPRCGHKQELKAIWIKIIKEWLRKMGRG